uniref:Uncharacterized protein n=1 Tax=Treponema phagedenis TaxID=162 RepID=A0A191VM73_TREPH|nr:hypothetical protein [Treponema phagedenis]
MVVNVFYFCIARKAFFTKRQRTCPIFSAQINSLIPPPPPHTHTIKVYRYNFDLTYILQKSEKSAFLNWCSFFAVFILVLKLKVVFVKRRLWAFCVLKTQEYFYRGALL